MAEYCTDGDLYSYGGLPRGAVPNPARLASAVSASADTIALDVHGFETDDAIAFRAEAGGSLPAPLVANTRYYAIRVDDNVFQVAATESGAAIDLTTAGSRVLVIAALPLQAARAFASRVIDQSLPAHLVPLSEPYPEIVRITAAELAVAKLLQTKGNLPATLGQMVTDAQNRLARWARGVPVRGDNVPPRANLAVSATAPRTDRRGWMRWGGRE